MRARSSLRQVLAQIAVVTAAIACAAVVGAAGAHASTVAVAGVVTASSGGIDVHLADPDALWVRVTVRAPDSTALASTDDLSYSDDRGWHTDNPITLPGQPLGSYPVDVDYRSTDGTVQHWSGATKGAAGEFAYALHTSITGAAFDRTYTDYDHRSVRAAGKVVTFDPRTGVTSSAGTGDSVRVSYTTDDNLVHSTTAQTVAAGTFTATITPGRPVQLGTATLVSPAVNVRYGPGVDLAPVGVHVLRTRIVSGPLQIRVHAGHTFTISGTVQRLAVGQGWQPLAGATVVSTVYQPTTGTPGPVMGSGTSTSTGRFTYRATARRTSDLQTYLRATAYLSSDRSVDTVVNVPVSGSFVRTTFRQDQYGVVVAAGGLRGVCGRQTVVLQYSPGGRTGWVPIGSAVSADQYGNTACHFSVQGDGAYAGYYRLAVAESDQLLAVTSGAHRLSRTPTRITGFSVTPQHPLAQSTVTATGRLTQNVGSRWTALRGGHITVVFQVRGDSTWYLGAKGTTDAGGNFRISATFYASGSWAAYYVADTTHFYSETAVHNVVAG